MNTFGVKQSLPTIFDLISTATYATFDITYVKKIISSDGDFIWMSCQNTYCVRNHSTKDKKM